MTIPRRIIQTHRSPEIGRELRESWIEHHPGYEYLFFDHEQRRDFVATHRPGLLPIYDKLPGVVQQVDLFRYVVVHEIGGIYADADTVCCAPIHTYVDMEKDHMVVGMEMDMESWRQGAETYMNAYATPFQVCNWTFAAPRGHTVLALMMQRIAYYAAQMSPEQLTAWTHADRFTLELTGPMVWTRILTEFLSGTRVGNVTVLPRMVWGSLPQEQLLPANSDAIKVRHLFEGFWKTSRRGRTYEVRL